MAHLWGGQVRVGFGGAYGLDAPAAAEICAAHGLDREAALRLLPYCGEGIAQATAEAADR